MSQLSWLMVSVYVIIGWTLFEYIRQSRAIVRERRGRQKEENQLVKLDSPIKCAAMKARNDEPQLSQKSTATSVPGTSP